MQLPHDSTGQCNQKKRTRRETYTQSSSTDEFASEASSLGDAVILLVRERMKHLQYQEVCVCVCASVGVKMIQHIHTLKSSWLQKSLCLCKTTVQTYLWSTSRNATRRARTDPVFGLVGRVRPMNGGAVVFASDEHAWHGVRCWRASALHKQEAKHTLHERWGKTCANTGVKV